MDTYLADGSNVMTSTAGSSHAAVLHSNSDGLDIAVKDGRILGMRGRQVHRVNHGRLDPKDLFGRQANHSWDRLSMPLIRRDGVLTENGLGHRDGRRRRGKSITARRIRTDIDRLL